MERKRERIQGARCGSLTLATCALCGFANFSTITIQIGVGGALVPPSAIGRGQNNIATTGLLG